MSTRVIVNAMPTLQTVTLQALDVFQIHAPTSGTAHVVKGGPHKSVEARAV